MADKLRYSYLMIGLAAGSCSIVEPPAITPGMVTVSLTAAPESTGALLLELRGGSAITSVVAGNTAYQIRHGSLNGTTVQVLLRGDLTVGAVLRVGVSDQSRLPQGRVLDAVSKRSAGYAVQAPQSYTLQSVATAN